MSPGKSMSMTTRRILAILLCLGTICSRWDAVVQGFNVDVSTPLLFTNADTESQFGLSLALHREGVENMLLVGAPRAISSGYTADQAIGRSGALYKCGIDISTRDQAACDEIIVDTTGHEYLDANDPTFQSTNASGQWLGSTLQSGGPDGSIVVCRPLYTYQTNNNGRINDRYLRGGCFVINGGLTSPNPGLLDTVADFNPCASNSVGYRVFYRCGFGGSAAVRDTRIVYGATGACLWNGRIWYTNGGITDASDLFYFPQSCRFELDYEYYFGHAVAFGNFRDDSSLEVAISAPRYDHGYGRVSLYNDAFMKYDMIDASDLATYFGHSLAASDLNNDGYDDLVIGAPMFTDEERSIDLGWEVGKIFIYYNDQQGGFYLDDYDVIIGTGAGCRFGYSLSALGDINQDGFNDLAVGAPFCNGGDDGKVFIYHGSGINQPLGSSPQQTLSPSIIEHPLKFFGFVLSAGLDVDGNTYPDFAVGAHESQTAVLFRSRAVVMTEAQIYPVESAIDLDVKNATTQQGVSVTGFSVAVCLRYSGQGLPSNLDFSYEIILDASRQSINRRAAFIDTSSTIRRGQMTAAIDQQMCENHAAYVMPLISDKQTPMELRLVHGIAEASQTSYAVNPIMSSAVSNQTLNSLGFVRDCAGSTCYPNLGIQTSISITQLTIGKAETFVLNVDVTNAGEDAFLSVLDVIEPPGLFFVNVLRLRSGTIVSCSLSAATRTRSCNIGNPISAGDQMTVGLQYQTAAYSSFNGPVVLSVSVRSTDAERPGQDADNDMSNSIPVYASSNLVLSGNSIPETLLITENTTNNADPIMTHVIRLQNDGPSFIGASFLEILWPIKLPDGKKLMNVTEVTMETGIPCQLIPRINEDAAKENNITEFEDTAVNATIYTLWADCDSLPECLAIRCPLTSLAIGADSAIIMTVQSRLSHDTVFAMQYDGTIIHFIQILSTASVTVNGTIYPGIPYLPHPTVSPLEIQTEIRVQYENRIVIVTPPPIWVYIVSSLAGLLILIIFVIVLYKIKFFQRKQITQEQRDLLNEHRKSVLMSQAPDPEPDSPDVMDMEESPLARDGSVAGLIR